MSPAPPPTPVVGVVVLTMNNRPAEFGVAMASLLAQRGVRLDPALVVAEEEQLLAFEDERVGPAHDRRAAHGIPHTDLMVDDYAAYFRGSTLLTDQRG